jgi:UDP-glucose 4-epimerase
MVNYQSIFKNKNVMVTGGLGFVGSALAYKLVDLGANILLVDSLIPGYGGNIRNIYGIEDKVKVNVSDVRDKYSMNHLIQGQNYLFNLAGTLSHVDSMRDPFTDLEINCVSQLRILESCKNYNREVKVIFAATRGEYGKADYLPVDEKHPLHPTDINGINNIAGEWYHILYNNIYGIRTTSLRLTNTYGPRHQMKHHKQGIINWFIRLVIDNQTIKIFGDGKQVRDTNYVDDVVEALLLAAASEKSNGEVFNLGGTPVNLVDIVKKMIAIAGKGKYEFVPFPEDSQKIEIGDYIANWKKIKNALGWEPKVRLEEGLKRTIDYYEKNKGYYW